MESPPPIPASVRALFPRRANQEVYVRAAARWSPSHRTSLPPAGWDGWRIIDDHATESLLQRLADLGYTHVRLHNVGINPSVREARISELL